MRYGSKTPEEVARSMSPKARARTIRACVAILARHADDAVAREWGLKHPKRRRSILLATRCLLAVASVMDGNEGRGPPCETECELVKRLA
jgi:hypothetical protein